MSDTVNWQIGATYMHTVVSNYSTDRKVHLLPVGASVLFYRAKIKIIYESLKDHFLKLNILIINKAWHQKSLRHISELIIVTMKYAHKIIILKYNFNCSNISLFLKVPLLKVFKYKTLVFITLE